MTTIKRGAIYTFPGKPGFWRVTEGNEESGEAERIPKAEALADLKEQVLLKRLGELCGVNPIEYGVRGVIEKYGVWDKERERDQRYAQLEDEYHCENE